MKSIAIRNPALALVAIVGLCASEQAAARALLPLPRDPLLKRAFNPSTTRFEAAPTDLTARCPDLVNERYGARLWIFARAAAPDGDRLMVAGLLTPKRRGDRPLVNDQGAMLRLGAHDCELLGPAAEPFRNADAYADTITAPVMTTLKTDAARRYRIAYGRVRLRAMLRVGNGLPAALRPAFAAAAR